MSEMLSPARRRMSKMQTLRDALKNGAQLTLDQILDAAEATGEQIFNRKKTRDLLYYMKSTGEIRVKGSGAEQRFTLSTTRPAKKPPAKKTKSTKPQTSAPRSYRDVARKVERLTVHVPSLAQRHVGTTLEILEALIELEVDQPSVITAFRAHKEAIELLGEHA